MADNITVGGVPIGTKESGGFHYQKWVVVDRDNVAISPHSTEFYGLQTEQTRRRPAANRLSAPVALTNGSTQALAARATRRKFMFENNTDVKAYFFFGTPATTGAYSFSLEPNGGYYEDVDDVGLIMMIGAATPTTGQIMVTEWWD